TAGDGDHRRRRREMGGRRGPRPADSGHAAPRSLAGRDHPPRARGRRRPPRPVVGAARGAPHPAIALTRFAVWAPGAQAVGVVTTAERAPMKALPGGWREV